MFSSTGEKKGTLELPASLFGAPINWGLMHQALVSQQSNRRQSPAHVKTRGEIVGSTKKLYSQKHTGRARRGPIRSPLMRGGGKTFGPRNDKNYTKDMPRKMRHAAMRSCLSLQASKDAVLVLETYPNDVKTKTVAALLKKLPVDMGRKIVFVTPGVMRGLQLSARNIEGVKTLDAHYLNPEDVLNARHIIFLKDAIAVAEQVFGKKDITRVKLGEEPTKTKKPAVKKAIHSRKASTKKKDDSASKK